MDYNTARERMRELQEEIDDLDKMQQMQSLSLKDVLSEIDTPVNSDSEEDEVRKSVLFYIVINCKCTIFLALVWSKCHRHCSCRSNDSS